MGIMPIPLYSVQEDQRSVSFTRMACGSSLPAITCAVSDPKLPKSVSVSRVFKFREQLVLIITCVHLSYGQVFVVQ